MSSAKKLKKNSCRSLCLENRCRWRHSDVTFRLCRNGVWIIRRVTWKQFLAFSAVPVVSPHPSPTRRRLVVQLWLLSCASVWLQRMRSRRSLTSSITWSTVLLYNLGAMYSCRFSSKRPWLMSFKPLIRLPSFLSRSQSSTVLGFFLCEVSTTHGEWRPLSNIHWTSVDDYWHFLLSMYTPTVSVPWSRPVFSRT